MVANALPADEPVAVGQQQRRPVEAQSIAGRHAGENHVENFLRVLGGLDVLADLEKYFPLNIGSLLGRQGL